MSRCLHGEDPKTCDRCWQLPTDSDLDDVIDQMATLLHDLTSWRQWRRKGKNLHEDYFRTWRRLVDDAADLTNTMRTVGEGT